MVVGACNDEGGATTESMGVMTGGATGVTTGGATTGGTTSAVPTTTEAPTTGMATGGTTGAPAEYCHGFDVRAPMPFLDLHVLGGEPLADGTSLPLECGGLGVWMFGLYPAFGGWDPGADTVTFTIEVDVEGFDVGPMGHFFSGEVPYYIGCEQFDGGLLGVLPVTPPALVKDLSMLDGKPAKLRVSVPAGTQALMVERSVTLSAPKDRVMEGCPPGA